MIDHANSCVADTVIADLISDHRAVHCHLAVRKPPFKREERTYRKVKATNPEKPDYSLGELPCQSDYVFSEFLDKHAPLKTKCLTIRPDAPRMDDSFISARKERRRLEGRWRFFRLTVDKAIFTNQIEQVKTMLDLHFMIKKSHTRLAIQKPCSRQLAPCCIRNICLHCLTTIILDNWLIVSATFSLTKLPRSYVILMSKIDTHLIAWMSHVVSPHVYQRSCPP